MFVQCFMLKKRKQKSKICIHILKEVYILNLMTSIVWLEGMRPVNNDMCIYGTYFLIRCQCSKILSEIVTIIIRSRIQPMRQPKKNCPCIMSSNSFSSSESGNKALTYFRIWIMFAMLGGLHTPRDLQNVVIMNEYIYW